MLIQPKSVLIDLTQSGPTTKGRAKVAATVRGRVKITSQDVDEVRSSNVEVDSRVFEYLLAIAHEAFVRDHVEERGWEYVAPPVELES